MELNERPRAAESNGRLAAWLFFVGVMAALSYSARFAPEDEADTRDFVYQWDLAIAGAVQYGIMVLLILWIAAGSERRALLGLRRPSSWPVALGLVLACGVAVFVASALLEPVLHAGEEQGLTPEGWDGDRALPFVANALVIVAAAPIVEELLFRGIGFALLLRFGRVAAILISGGTFGLVHGLVGGFVILAVFGVVLAWLRDRTESVLPTILLHALFNGFALLVSVLVDVED